MELAFSKMQGIGNDYVYVDTDDQPVPDPAALARFISDRHFGVGSDGLILISRGEKADFRMRIFNADGSEGRMCGNGIRCVGKYVYDRGLTDRTDLTVETLGGVRRLRLQPDRNGQIGQVTVDMGKAILRPRDIPVRSDLERFVAQPVEAGGRTFLVTCVSMGNPHAVVFCDDVAGLDLETLGPPMEHCDLFPDRINTEFVRVLDEKTLEMRVWERGSGETFACGTGACASVVAAVLCGHCACDADVTVRLRGGELSIRYCSDGQVFMRGPAAHVFDGTLEYPI